MSDKPSKLKGRLGIVLLVLLVAGGATAYCLNVLKPSTGQPVSEKPKRIKVELAKDAEHTLVVPEDVRRSLNIRKGGKDIVAVADKPTGQRPLVLSASTMFDPSKLYRVRARFAPAEIVKIENHSPPDYTKEGTQVRKLQMGDYVEEGTPLAVFYSVDVGSKKNDLIDSLVNYKFDKDLYERALKNPGLPAVIVEGYRKNVQADQNAIDRSYQYLATWNIPDEDIKAVEKEAEDIIKKEGRREIERKKRDPKELNPWGKVVLKAPASGIIVEQNVAEKEIVNDSTTNLYQIANSDKLLVLANCPEEDVKELIELRKSGYPLEWRLRPLGAPNSDGIPGPIEEIAQLVDPSAHTVPVKGRIPNKDGVLRATQYLTATIELPPPKDVVEIPASAVADDGKQAIVFIQTNEGKSEYTMRRVMVTHRFEDKVFVRSKLSEREMKLTPEENDLGLMPKRPLQLGERVIKSGLLELKKELEDLESAKTE